MYFCTQLYFLVRSLLIDPLKTEISKLLFPCDLFVKIIVSLFFFLCFFFLNIFTIISMNQTIKSTEEEGKSDYIVFYPEFSCFIFTLCDNTRDSFPFAASPHFHICEKALVGAHYFRSRNQTSTPV